MIAEHASAAFAVRWPTRTLVPRPWLRVSRPVASAAVVCEDGGVTHTTTIRVADIADWEAVRDIRLHALHDAPDAFGSTYQREAEFTRTDWINRLTSGSATFLAYHPRFGADAIGICAGFSRDTSVVELVSMWVDPRARGHGVAEPLVGAVADWAGNRDATQVHLWVTEANEPARRLYQRCGFTFTGERQSLPSNPSLPELGMARSPQ